VTSPTGHLKSEPILGFHPCVTQISGSCDDKSVVRSERRYWNKRKEREQRKEKKKQRRRHESRAART
jgi:hypothetical protein